jgi:hypothetical protein
VISDEGMEIEHEPVKGDILNDDTLHAHLESIQERPNDNNLIIPTNICE